MENSGITPHAGTRESKDFPIIVNNFRYHLTQLTVHADGSINCWGMMDFEEFKQKLNSGWIRVDIPENQELHIQGLGSVNYNEFLPEKTVEGFIKEVEDAIIELGGGKGRVTLCMEAFKVYLLDDCSTNFKQLKASFKEVPEHKNVIFEYIDYKDPLIQLMKTGVAFSIEERRYFLKDYFEDEWEEKDLK